METNEFIQRSHFNCLLLYGTLSLSSVLVSGMLDIGVTNF